MKYKTFVANFIKLFLAQFTHIAISFDSVYATSGVNYAKKSFMKLPRWGLYYKLFTAVIFVIS
jgi:hypothetical protein